MPKTALRLVVTAISLLAVTVLIDILPESIFANNGLTEQSSLNPARVALDWIRRLPTEPLFYLLIVVVAGTYFVVRWYLHARRNDRLIGQESQNLLSRLSSDDWHAIQDLRRRAFASRTHADVTLGGVFALLFGSIYLVLFILPQVPETDRVVEQEVRLQERYGETLKNIGRGEYWLELDESTARTLDRRNVTEPAIQTRRGRTLAELPRTYRNIVFGLTQINFSRSRENKSTIFAIHPGRVQFSPDGGQTWNDSPQLSLRADELIVSVAFSQDGTHGLLSGDEGSIFETDDSGKTWREVTSIDLKDDEWLLTSALSGDGTRGILASERGSVFAKGASGKTWSEVTNINRKEDEWLLTSALGHDGAFGILAGDRGSIFTTSDSGKTWETMDSISILEKEWIVFAALKSEGSPGLMVGNMGTVILSNDGETWFKSEVLPLTTGARFPERIVTTIFDPTHKYGMIVSNRNSIFETDDGGKTWNIARSNFSLNRNDRVYAGTIGVGGLNRIVAGNRGSISWTQDEGRSWRPIDAGSLQQNEWIVDLAVNIDSSRFVLASNRGSMFEVRADDTRLKTLIRSSQQGYSHFERMASFLSQQLGVGVFGARKDRAFVTMDAGNTLRRAVGMIFRENERIDLDLFGDDRKVGLVATTGRSMYRSGDGGRTWTVIDEIVLNQNERISTAALSNSDGRGLVEGNAGSLFMTSDGGMSWNRPEGFALKTGETIDSVLFLGDTDDSTDKDEHTVIIGNDGTIVVNKRNDGKWTTTVPDRRNVSVVAAFSGGESDSDFIAIQDERERIHVLKDYGMLLELSDGDIAGTRRAINGADEILRNSAIGREIAAFLVESASVESGPASSRNGDTWADRFIGEVTLMRIATFTVMFFLVQLLVRTYRYNIRLGAFWDSRADAVLLASTFSRDGAVSFRELVEAVAPDKFDFKPPSRPAAESTSFFRRPREN